MNRSLICLVAMAFLISGCEMMEDLPDWMGGGTKKEPLPGKRVAVLNEMTDVKADDSLAGFEVSAPALEDNDAWNQAGGGAEGITGNLKLTGLTHSDRATVGDGNGWEQPVYPSPVAAGGFIYAMDAKGYITAHSMADIGKIAWTNKSAVTKHEPDLLGGGLAYDGGKLYATTGRGKVFALDAATGKQLWQQPIGVPLRAAPKVGGGRVYALSVDNQLFALDAGTGRQLWNDRGINENAGFLAAISPAVTDSLVLAPYSSGEIHALDSVSGQELWTDTLLLPRRNSATASFSGIGGNPIVRDDTVYVSGSGGFTAAIALLTGRRIWEQDIPSLNTTWVAGDFLYVLSNDDRLYCLMRADGRAKWVKQLPHFVDEKKRRSTLVWRGPILAGGQLLIAGTHGQMLALSPKDGATLATIDIPEQITDTPIVAGGRLYFLTQDARLHVLY